MKKLLSILFSPRTTLGLLVIFAIALGAATFIENSYDTATAKILVYNAKWFEAIMVLMIINYIGSIQRYHFLTWKKISGLIFHTAFAIIIIGAGVTRYVGFEGNMHIREGASSDYIFSNKIYLTVKSSDDVQDYLLEEPLNIGQNIDNSFEFFIDTKQKGNIGIAYKDHIINAVESFVEGEGGDINLIHLTISVQGHKDEITIKDGETQMTHDFPISYNDISNPYALRIISKNGNLFINYPEKIKTSAMPEMTVGEIAARTEAKFETMHLYEPEGTGIALVLTKVVNNAKIKYVQGTEEQKGPNALILDVTFDGKTKEAVILGGSGYVEYFHKVDLEGMDLNISYGAKKIELPFSLQLNKFELDRYAGSMSPSSYASEVTLIDQSEGVRKDHRIYMNNVLDYNGYRFFQSSYDQDEKERYFL